MKTLPMGLKIRGIKKKNQLDEIIENALVKADLWKEVKDKLNESGLKPVRRADAETLHRTVPGPGTGSDSV